jgi:hypothetical protein
MWNLVLGLATVLAVIGPREVEAAPVVVRVYQSVGLDPALERASLTEATAVFRDAFVTVRWLLCSSADQVDREACALPLRAGDRVVRIVEGPRTPDSRVPLGEAAVPANQDGVLATIYYDRVARVAAQARIAVGALLGRVIAHELGHLLMASSSHATGGLMRASWNLHQLAQGRPVHWSFSPDEVRTLQRRIASR